MLCGCFECLASLASSAYQSALPLSSEAAVFLPLINYCYFVFGFAQVHHGRFIRR